MTSNLPYFLGFLLVVTLSCQPSAESTKTAPLQTAMVDTLTTVPVTFESAGVTLSGSLYSPSHPQAAVVLVHGSDRVPRMAGLAEQLAHQGLMVLTYDKRGVGASGGVYAGPEVGTNNISVENLNLLAADAAAAVNVLHSRRNDLPIGLLGASQAGWIIPIVANNNPQVGFMVLFSSPTITTLEQLRFQFFTNGQTDFWDHHTDAEVRAHLQNAPDRYVFTPTDPKESLNKLNIPGLWLYGQQDIQIPVSLCIEQLNALKMANKPFDYVLFPALGHYTYQDAPLQMAVNWIKQHVVSGS